MEQEPELVRPEGMVAQPIGKAGVFEILDPEFGTTTSLDVEGVERVRFVLAGGNDKADIGSFGQHLGLDNHPSFLLPTAGGVLCFPHEPHLLAGLGMPFGGLGNAIERYREKA